jgi:hypothetical protein
MITADQVESGKPGSVAIRIEPYAGYVVGQHYFLS